MKRLVEDYPQDFVDWLRRRARFNRILKTELSHRIIYTDMLLEVLEDEGRSALHLEFQAEGDSQMAKRLWEYNARATIQYECPIYSYVVYLKKDVQIAESPYLVTMPDGQEVHRFHFGVIELAEIEPEELQRMGLKGLLPLLPLGRNGKRHEVVDAAIAGLAPPGEKPNAELLAFTLEFASLVFKDEPDREWLRRRFQVFHDILRETWVSQELLQEGEERGLKKGLQQEVQRQRETIVDIVLERFPKIVHFVKKQVEAIEDPTILRHLIVKMSTFQTADEVQQYLFDVGKDEEKR